MRVSEFYGLNRSQGDLDFVDVDIGGDVALFIDPRALRLLQSEWGAKCRNLLRNFFHVVLDAIRAGDDARAKRLLVRLREPNEIHLGYSIHVARGHGLGPNSAEEVWDALSKSEAVKTGMLEDLEDTVLLVPGIGPDIVSDVAANVIRKQLIGYTQQASEHYGIPLENDIDSGPLWNPRTKEWASTYVELPRTSQGKLLLVPKSIVRRSMDYDGGEYYRHYVIEHLRDVEEAANTELVRVLKGGRKHVFVKDLEQKYGKGKHAAVQITRRYPIILENYRKYKRQRVSPPMEHEDLGEAVGALEPDLRALLKDVRGLRAGRSHADAYHMAIEKLLTALFYPDLTGPEVEYPIHAGRKIIDIRYTNTATRGFFDWLGDHYPAPYVYVECKNYTGDLKNPELDQLSGRFSPRRGKFGLLLCRRFKNKIKFLERCKDTARDDRGYMVVIDDSDLQELVDDFVVRGALAFDWLRKRLDELIN